MNLDNAVLAWIEYGDHDMLTANQQAAEKYLKAGLAAFSLPIPKTHDLLSLNRQLAPCFPKIAELEMDCDRLTDFGTVTRYPNESVSWMRVKSQWQKMPVVVYVTCFGTGCSRNKS